MPPSVRLLIGTKPSGIKWRPGEAGYRTAIKICSHKSWTQISGVIEKSHPFSSHSTSLNEHFHSYFIDINTVPGTGQRCIQKMWLEGGGGGGGGTKEIFQKFRLGI